MPRKQCGITENALERDKIEELHSVLIENLWIYTCIIAKIIGKRKKQEWIWKDTFGLLLFGFKMLLKTTNEGDRYAFNAMQNNKIGGRVRGKEA